MILTLVLTFVSCEIFVIIRSRQSLYDFHRSQRSRIKTMQLRRIMIVASSVAEPYHVYAAPGKNFDAAPASASSLLYGKPTKGNLRVGGNFSSNYL
jgi:hypothetical protein